MMNRIQQALLRPWARITGVVYLLYFLMATLAEVLVGRKLVGYGHATNLFATCCYVAVTLLFYGMFKPVSRPLSLIGALLSLAGCVVMTLNDYPRVSLPISPLLFFGPYCLLIGYLILRSNFLPRVLGLLMALAGFGCLAFLSPTVAHSLSLYIEILGILAEASLMLWLIAMGVNVQRWNQQAGAA